MRCYQVCTTKTFGIWFSSDAGSCMLSHVSFDSRDNSLYTDVPDPRCHKSSYECNGGHDHICDNVLLVTSSALPGDRSVSLHILLTYFLVGQLIRFVDPAGFYQLSSQCFSAADWPSRVCPSDFDMEILTKQPLLNQCLSNVIFLCRGCRLHSQ